MLVTVSETDKLAVHKLRVHNLTVLQIINSTEAGKQVMAENLRKRHIHKKPGPVSPVVVVDDEEKDQIMRSYRWIVQGVLFIIPSRTLSIMLPIISVVVAYNKATREMRIN